jgi:glycosyltransferase involved in cell wall biosynthesis
MHNEPSLSIVTAVYNDAENLESTIKSVKSQSWSDYELVIIDGKSSDGTLDVIRANEKYMGFWLSEPDEGIYDAMNKGIKASRGKYIEFLNAGDVYTSPTCLESVFSENDKDYDVVYGEINLYDQKGRFFFQVPALDFTIENIKRYGTGTVNHQAFFIKRKIAPYFSTHFHLKGELNWYIDILLQNRELAFKHLPFPIIDYKQGGKGYRHFWANLYEWILLIQERFGLMENLRNRRTYWNFIRYRYPFLKKYLPF